MRFLSWLDRTLIPRIIIIARITPQDTAMVDPKIALAWSSEGDSAISAVVTCAAPAPFVYLDVGTLHGRWSDSGFTCEWLL